MKDRRAKRISISAYDAEHVYEWLRDVLARRPADVRRLCRMRARLGRRLERLIGPGAVRYVARLVRKHPGRTATRISAKKTHATPHGSALRRARVVARW